VEYLIYEASDTTTYLMTKLTITITTAAVIYKPIFLSISSKKLSHNILRLAS